MKALWAVGLAPLLAWAATSLAACSSSDSDGAIGQDDQNVDGEKRRGSQAPDDSALEREVNEALNPQGARASQVAFVYDGSIVDAIEFFRPHATGNGRSCATCHRPEDNFALTPATVEARWQALQARRQFDPNADDPLFRSIDADDFDQDFTTLRTKALVRVNLPLPSTVKLTNDPSATTTSVWRSVPTVMNTAFTAPFQSDGRAPNLEAQALAAMRDHSTITSDPSPQRLARMVGFQTHLYSSLRTRSLAQALAAGTPPPDTDPPLNALETQGKETFKAVCGTCHGGPTQTVNTEKRIFSVPQRGPLVDVPQAFVNVESSTPRAAPGGFFVGLPSAGLPETSFTITRADGTTQLTVTSDPGRVLVTGDSRETKRFDVPTLFGISRTAPYFHDNFAPDLETMVKHYQALFKFAVFVGEMGAFAPVTAGGGCVPGACNLEGPTDEEVPGLIAYLKKL